MGKVAQREAFTMRRITRSSQSLQTGVGKGFMPCLQREAAAVPLASESTSRPDTLRVPAWKSPFSAALWLPGALHTRGTKSWAAWGLAGRPEVTMLPPVMQKSRGGNPGCSGSEAPCSGRWSQGTELPERKFLPSEITPPLGGLRGAVGAETLPAELLQSPLLQDATASLRNSEPGLSSRRRRITTPLVLPPSLDLCSRRGMAAVLQVQPAPTPRALHRISLHKRLLRAALFVCCRNNDILVRGLEDLMLGLVAGSVTELLLGLKLIQRAQYRQEKDPRGRWTEQGLAEHWILVQTWVDGWLHIKKIALVAVYQPAY